MITIILQLLLLFLHFRNPNRFNGIQIIWHFFLKGCSFSLPAAVPYLQAHLHYSGSWSASANVLTWSQQLSPTLHHCWGETTILPVRKRKWCLHWPHRACDKECPPFHLGEELSAFSGCFERFNRPFDVLHVGQDLPPSYPKTFAV